MKILQKNLPKTFRFYLLPALLFIAIVAANIYLYRQSSKNGVPPTDIAPGAGPSLTTPPIGSILPIEKVRSLAEAEAPDTAITKIKLESNEEKFIYIVDLADTRQLVFDAQTGTKLLNFITDPDSKSINKALPTDFTRAISFDNAREIAQAQKPGGVVSKIELVPARDTTIYSVHFVDGSSVNIVAADGTVIQKGVGESDSGNLQTLPESNPSIDPVPLTEPAPSGDETDSQDSNLLNILPSDSDSNNSS